MQQKEIEIDVYKTSMTVSQAVEKGKEYMEAVDTSHTINRMMFELTDNKTPLQITFILGDVRRFCNALEHELLEQKRKEAGL